MENILLIFVKVLFSFICLVLSIICWLALYKLREAKDKLCVLDEQVKQVKYELPKIKESLETLSFDYFLKKKLLNPNLIFILLDLFLLHRSGKLTKFALLKLVTK